MWSSHELLTLLRQLLPHFFQYIDTLEPREDGEHHWDLCEKIRDKLIVCEADEISGNTAYLVRGRLGVNGLDRCLWIGEFCKSSQESTKTKPRLHLSYPGSCTSSRCGLLE